MPEKEPGFWWEVAKWMGGGLAAAGAAVGGALNARINRVHKRIDRLEDELEKKVVTQAQFEEFRKANDESHEEQKKILQRLLTTGNQ